MKCRLLIINNNLCEQFVLRTKEAAWMKCDVSAWLWNLTFSWLSVSSTLKVEAAVFFFSLKCF